MSIPGQHEATFAVEMKSPIKEGHTVCNITIKTSLQVATCSAAVLSRGMLFFSFSSYDSLVIIALHLATPCIVACVAEQDLASWLTHRHSRSLKRLLRRTGPHY